MYIYIYICMYMYRRIHMYIYIYIYISINGPVGMMQWDLRSACQGTEVPEGSEHGPLAWALTLEALETVYCEVLLLVLT